jgi:tetratricopeptide (TPR) repeat protein
LAKEAPGDAQAQRGVWVSYNKLGDVTLQLGQAEQALGYYRKVLEIAERLARESPGDARAQRDVSVSYNKLGDVTLQLGQAEQALGYYRQGLEIRERLAKKSPEDAQAQRDMSVSYSNLGNVTLQMGNAEGALGYYREDLEISERLAKESPGDAQAQRGLMYCRYRLGQTLLELGKYAEASVEYQAGVAVLEKMSERKQNVESAGKEKGLLEALISRCQELTVVTGEVAGLDGLDEKTRPNAWLLRVAEFARLGRVADALKAAERLTKLEPVTAESQYNTACAFSLVYAAKRKEVPMDGPVEPEVEKLAKRALEYLREAVKRGGDNVEQLEKDPVFAAIREQAEFQEVLKGLREGKTNE